MALLKPHMISRRKFLGGAVVVGTTTIAGCSGSSPTWKEEFKEETSEADQTALESSPVVYSEVSSEIEVKTALGILGWKLSGETVSEVLIEDLNTSISTAEELRTRLDRAVGFLNEGLRLVEEMKNTSAFGTSVWDAATEAVPRLENFVELARALRTELEDQSERLNNLQSETESVITHLNSLSGPQTPAYGSLAPNFSGAIEIYQSIIADFSDIRADIQLVAEISAETEATARDIPLMGNEIASVYGATSGTFQTLDELLGTFENRVESITADVGDVKQNAASEANTRYSSISKQVNGSEEQMALSEVDTNVEAYT